MIFGPVPLSEAEGCILAHTTRLPNRVLKKGATLTQEAIQALRDANHDPIIAATLEPGDIPEDTAANRLADALLAPHLARTRPGTGRVNLVATTPGLLRIDRNALDALNAIDESLTTATLPDWSSVTSGEMLATIKIIPFAVPGPLLDRALAAAATRPMRLHPYTPRTVGLVMSTLPGLKPSILAGTAEATRARVEALGGTLLPPIECPHDTQAIANALRNLRHADIRLVAGASAVVDRRDVGPAAIVQAGGEILHFGMPVDPGNLICLGRLDGKPALILPGCARSPKLNGIDWVLQRLFAGIDVDGPAIAAMGVGGLLNDVGPRPLPRAKATPPATPPIAAILLAAGRSARMAPHHKLLLRGQDGLPLIARAADALLASPLRPILVITGHRAPDIQAALAPRNLTFIHANHHHHGLSASLRAGLAAGPPPRTPAVLVALGDMPLLTPATIDRLLAAYDPDKGRLIIVPTHAGTYGNPILWDARFIPEMLLLQGDRGARPLLDRHADQVHRVEIPDDSVLRDIDTPTQLATLPPTFQPT